MYKTILFSIKDHVATLTLNRPDTYNAFNTTMSEETLVALKHCRQTPDIRVIVLTGAGKAFCSGQDLKDPRGQARSLGETVEAYYNPLIRLIRNTEKPFICRLNGVAAGAGASLAIACDYVVAAEPVMLVWAFANIGLVLDSGSSWFLPRLVGQRKAFELASLGEKVSASQALAWGLINEVVGAEALDDATRRIAERYAQAAPKAMALIKRMLNRAFESPLDQALDLERVCQDLAGRTEDFQEGVAAFVEKRAAVFKGW